MSQRGRVVVTGIGLVTPLGIGLQRVWPRLLSGEHGFAEVTSMDTSEYRVHRGAEVKQFNFSEYLPELESEWIGRSTQFALAATQLAMNDAGLAKGALQAIAAGVVMGTTSGESSQVERFNDYRMQGDWGALGGEYMRIYPSHSIPAKVASVFHATDVAPLMLPAACAAGNYAIGHAADHIRDGKAEIMLAGGADAFSRIIYTGFSRLLAIAPELCQPFDQDRKGMIPGEGAGILVLESLQHARARGAEIYAEILGYGLSCDAYHMTGSHPENRGAFRAMEKALAASDRSTADISYVCAHGTGTKSNDMHESRSLQLLFGERAKGIPVSSIKSMLGHTMGAASAIEAGICAMAIREQRIPPTANLKTVDPEFDLDYVKQARTLELHSVMNNAYAFGGSNACLILCAHRDGSTEPRARPESGGANLAPEKARVVVTGCGGFSAMGASVDVIFERLCKGESAFSALALPEDYPDLNARGAKIQEFDPKAYLGDRNFRPLDATARYALIAASEALAQSAWSAERLSAAEVGLSLGTQFCSLHSITQFDYSAQMEGVRYAKPLDFANTVINAAAGQLAIWFGLTGANTTIAAGYISGAQAVLHAYQRISCGQEAQLLVGGVEELSQPAVLGYARAGRLAPGTEPPSIYSDQRNGFWLAEGAAFLMVEALDDAYPPAADTLGELLGGASGFCTGCPTVERIASTIGQALAEAGVDAAAIDFVYANGNGLTELDANELSALGQVFGSRAQPVPVVAIKALTGEWLGASGAFQVLFALQSLRTCQLPGMGPCPAEVPAGICLNAKTSSNRAKIGLVLTLGVDGYVNALVLGQP